MAKKPRQLTEAQIALLAALGVAVLGGLLPGLGQLLLPLQYLNTHLHELCHALMACLTGGNVEAIEVHANGSGITPVYGGNFFLIGSAGYVGAAMLGAVIGLCGRLASAARLALIFLAMTLASSLLIWVRADGVGIAAGWLWVVLLGLGGWLLKDFFLLFAVQFIGIELSLASIQSLWVLFKVSVVSNQTSDARLVAGITGVPALVWAALWSLIGIGLAFASVRAIWASKPNPPTRSFGP